MNYVRVCKIHIHIPPKMRLSSLLLQKSFIYIKLANVWRVILFAQNLIPIWPQSHGLIHHASPLLYLNSISFLAIFTTYFNLKGSGIKKTCMSLNKFPIRFHNPFHTWESVQVFLRSGLQKTKHLYSVIHLSNIAFAYIRCNVFSHLWHLLSFVTMHIIDKKFLSIQCQHFI